MDENKKDILPEGQTGAEDNSQLLPPREEPKKPSIAKRVAIALLSENYPNVFKNIYRNIIGPALRRIAVDAFTAVVYRGKQYGSSSPMDYDPSNPFTDYGAYSGGLRGSEDYSRFKFAEIRFRSRESAEKVLGAARSFLQKNRFICVSDYFMIANKTPENSYYNFGWNDLSRAYVSRYKDAKYGEVWYIKFPEPMYYEKQPM